MIALKSSSRVQLALILCVSGGLSAVGACINPSGPLVRDKSPAPVGTIVSGGDGTGGAFGVQPLGDDSDGSFVGNGGGFPPQAPVPDFGTPVTCGEPPPPISGGTLLVTRDGSRAIAADPDRDLVYVIDLASRTRRFTVALQPGDEPGRLAEDGTGRIHVALRGSGTLATLDPASGTITARRAACPAPRGVAWQASSDMVWVACATGELAALPAAGGSASITVVGRDLRDVIVDGDALSVTRFRSADLLRVAADGTISRIDAMPFQSNLFASHVVWRAVPGPGATVVAVHQAESTQSVSTRSSGGYGGGGVGGGPPVPPPLALPEDGGGDAGSGFLVPPTLPGVAGPVTSVLTIIGSDGSAFLAQQFDGVLPVDVAVSSDGSMIAAVAAGSGEGAAAIDNVYLFGQGGANLSAHLTVGTGQATALAFAANGDLLLQTREPAALWVLPDAAGVSDGGTPDAEALSIPLSPISKRDTGHDIFHSHAGALIACASCHPEGGDDGHVWLLDGNQRRTPSLRGTIAGTAPYHWPGDEADFSAIVRDVYVTRMNGAALADNQTAVLSAWVDSIPAPPAPTWVDANAAAAGRAIFERADVGCASCHSGAKFTNNATVDVGTGAAFQVPPLVGVGWRTPLFHNGCAATIADRFGMCSTATHGNIASLSPTDVTNLSAYLETL
jgi:mono/diheme cytochrome c family protein